MNVLFLTLLDFESIDEHGIYQDLLREFRKHDHQVYVVSPVERRRKQATKVIKSRNTTILKLRIGNTQKTNAIEKGISTLLIEDQFVRGIKKYFADVVFDLVIYSTPPITFSKVVEYIKRRDDAKTYLLLKDIFPQNAVDIGLLSKNGLTSLLYKYFRNKEKKLYSISDHIGCMSLANVDYVIHHNSQIDSHIVEVCPNSIEVIDKSIGLRNRQIIRDKYKIPLDKIVFIYGGNLGKPQGIDYIIDCLRSQKENDQAYFLIVGDGTEYKKIESFVVSEQPTNVSLMKRLPKEDYDTMVAACDVGLVFLDHRFTIPNFPSRLLSYLQAKLPVLACTDNNTDIGKVIVEGQFGWWCESNDINAFNAIVYEAATNGDLTTKGVKAFEYLKEHYDVSVTYRTIIESLLG